MREVRFLLEADRAIAIGARPTEDDAKMAENPGMRPVRFGDHTCRSANGDSGCARDDRGAQETAATLWAES